MSDYELLPIGNGKKKKNLSFDEALNLLGGEKTQESSLLSRVGDAGLDLAKGVVGAGEAAIGIGDIATGGTVGKLLQDYAGYDPKRTKAIMSDNYSTARQQANKEVEDATGFIDTTAAMLKNPSTIAGTVLESAPSMIGGGGSAQLLGKSGILLNNPVARGAIGEGLVGAGQTAEQIRQENPDGLLTPKQSLASTASGITTGLIGFGGGKLAQKMGVLDPQTVLAGGYPLPNGLSSRQTLGNVAKGFVSEGAFQELPQSATEQMWQNYAQDNPLMEGVPEASAAGLLAGGVMGGGTNLMHARHAKSNESNSSQQASYSEPPSDQLLLGHDNPNNPNSPKFNPNLDTNYNPVIEDLKNRADSYGLPNINPVSETLNRGVSNSFPIPAKPTGTISKALQAGNIKPSTRVLEGELVDNIPATLERRDGVDSWIDGDYQVIEPSLLEQQRRLTFNQENNDVQDIPRLYAPNSRAKAVSPQELRDIVRTTGTITPKQLMAYTGSNRIQAAKAIQSVKQEQQTLNTDFDSVAQAKTALKKLADHSSFEVGRLANSNQWAVVPKINNIKPIQGHEQQTIPDLAANQQDNVIEQNQAQPLLTQESTQTVDQSYKGQPLEDMPTVDNSKNVLPHLETSKTNELFNEPDQPKQAIENTDQESIALLDSEKATSPKGAEVASDKHERMDSKKNKKQVITENNDGQKAIKEESSGELTIPEIEAVKNNKESIESAPKTNKIEDFGEKMDGARKDYAQKLKESMSADIKNAPLSVTFPEPNYKQLIESGIPSKHVDLFRALRDEVPSQKPKYGSQLNSWSSKVLSIKELASSILTEGTYDKVMGDIKANKILKELLLRNDMYAALGHDNSLRSFKFRERDGRGLKDAIWIDKVSDKTLKFAPSSLLGIFENTDKASGFLKDYFQKNKGIKGKNTTFQLYQSRKDGSIYIAKKTGKNILKVKDGFKTVKEASDYMKSNKGELEEELKKLKTIENERRETNRPRIGKNWRNGKDISPEEFSQSFGFRGVQFGNYVEGKKRQSDLNSAYDALHDLASILNIPPRAISLNGELGLAFGARGKGGVRAASAHYEPSKVVINLTKKEGAGSLAHEWFHALDNYFMRMNKSDSLSYLSENSYLADPKIRQLIVDDFNNISKSIKDTGLYERSKILDAKRANNYWSTNVEMSARVFEDYIANTLFDKNQSNDYLVNLKEIGEYLRNDEYPYLLKDEQKPVFAAIEKLFKDIKTQETDDKNVMLYHRSQATKEAYERRIDSLYNGDRPKVDGVKVLDSSDILTLLGYKDTPMYLAEGKVVQGQQKHELTAEHWKKIPEWLENPIAVFKSDTVGGRLVAIAPETLNNQSIVMILEPETDTGGRVNVHLLLNAYDRNTPIPIKRWLDNEKLMYLDLQKSPTYSRQTGLQLPVSYRTLRGYKSTIYTDRDLVNYRQANDIAFNQSPTTNQSSNAAELSQKISEHIKSWSNAPKVEVVQSIDDLPKAIKEKVISDNALDANGIHHNGKVYLVADNISSPKEALFVTEHEVLGHYGLRGLFGNKLNPLLNNIYKNNEAVKKQADGLVNKYGYDKVLATEEVLSDMAATHDIKNMSFWNRLVAAFRNFSRKAGMTTRWSANDIAYLLANTRRFVKNGKTKNAVEGQQYSRAGQLLESGIEWLGKKTDKSEKISDRVTPEQRKIMQEKFAMFQPKNLKEKVGEVTDRLNEKLIQGIFDSFAPLKNISEEAYMQAHLSKGTEGAVEALLKFGKPKMQEGALNVEADGKGLFGILSELNSKGTTELNEWLSWMAANRAEILKRQGRENLFTDQDIKELKKLSEGEMSDGRNRAKVYENVRKQVMEYNKAVLDIAEESGLIDKENRKTWENGFYLPFYRVAEEEGSFSIGSANKLVGQKAFKKLKGGTNALDDLLVNMVSNWSHLLTASMKNQAGQKTLKSSMSMDIADKLDRLNAGEYLNNRTDEFRKGGQNIVWVMENGQQEFYQINDPLVFDALNMINHKGWNNPLIKIMGKFKSALTVGVTSSPTFRVRNLFRDTIQASAISNISYNPIANLVNGFNSTKHGSDTMNSLIAGGGAIRFGAMNDGNQGYQYRKLMKELNIHDYQVLNTQEKIKKAFSKAWNKYQELGDRGETINRAAIYEQAIADGKSHLKASFEARDLMNFTSAGKWASVRFLSQVLPFFNARLQGMYKLGRSAKDDHRRFAMVAGAVALASSLLYLLQKDDDDYKELPDWVRDTYWYVKLGDKALYIPKPFEVGALGSIAERGLEFALAGDDYTTKDFASTLTSILSDQLAMNPVPQIVKPAMEAAFNYDSFRGSSIDSMGQERLNPSDRYTANTSAGAVAVGKALNVSPQRIEHLIRGYFGWLGTQALNVTDIAIRPLTDLPSNPNKDFTKINNVFMLGDFVKNSEIGAGSKYLSRFYDSQKQIDQVYASLSNARKVGELEYAQELAKDDKLKLRRLYNTANKSITTMNQRMRVIRADKSLSSSEKNALIEEIQRQRNELAKRVDSKARKSGI